MYSEQKKSPSNQHQDRKHLRTKWLDQLLESRYRELFGDDHLIEDLPLVNQLNDENRQQINVLQTTTLSTDRQYERAMAEYQREKEAEITKYNFQVMMETPPTLQCQEKSVAIKMSPETPVIIDEPMEMTISHQEEMEIIREVNEIKTDGRTESKRQQKKKCWINRRKLKHMARTKKEKQDPSTSISRTQP